jgi:DMSO/TMAO reductase YedYZ molybdopterin-dependent catalytic subunit
VSRAFAVPDRARRRFLTRAAALGGLALAGPDAWLARLAAQAPCTGGPEGELVRVLPFSAPGARETPLGEMVGGAGLDARLFTDLSMLGAGALVTPTAQVYVRTAAPSRLPRDAAAWTIALGPGTGGSGPSVGAAALAGDAQPMGAHVMECAGNSNPQNFGLMSAVEWDGVLLSRVLARLSRPAGATAVMVTGLDDEASGSQASQPGASWVFPVEAVDRLAPFLAVRMNGQPLTPDHGAPVRLVVPGWYGCAWIKWITRIEWVAADAPATSQMREFAGRTHQDGVPALARDYAPPAIDTAAMPIRVEKRRGPSGLDYRIVGIVWGGSRPVDRLAIRVKADGAWTEFPICPGPRTAAVWSLWTYRWKPAGPGLYDIALRVPDLSWPQRRLAMGYYVRQVGIEEA